MTLDEIEVMRSYWRTQYKVEAKTLAETGHFVVTSTHPNWQGKIKCSYCKSTGYPGSIERNSLWWGQWHGENCSNRNG